LKEGVLTEKRRISISIPNSGAVSLLNPTQSVVIRLVECLAIYIEKGLDFHLFLDNLFVCWKSVIALKERGITVTRTIRKGASGYSPRLLQLKKLNRGLVWGELQAFIIKGVCCWLWQDSNAIIDKFLFFFTCNRAFKVEIDPFLAYFLFILIAEIFLLFRDDHWTPYRAHNTQKTQKTKKNRLKRLNCSITFRRLINENPPYTHLYR
jgi:hypothetical protein